MAEENEIQILIKLVDEMSGKISNIETSLNKFSKTAEKQNEKIANSFQDSTDSLIAVGNAASSVDSIFSSLTNLEIRLENATERVSGAEDRLYDAQYNLNKVMKSGTATAEDVAKAQKDVESATRSLTISQNNLERAQNQVVGTYIMIGVQVIKLAQSLPALITAVRGLTAASIAFMATPLGLAIAAIGIVVAAVTLQYIENKKATEEVNTATINLSEGYKKLNDEAGRANTAINEVYNSLMKMVQGQSEGEAQVLYDIAFQEKRLADLKAGIIDEELKKQYEGKIISRETLMELTELELQELRNRYDAKYGSQQNLNEALLNLEKIQREGINKEQQAINDFAKLGKEDQLKYLKDTYNVEVIRLQNELYQNEINNVIKLEEEYDKAYEKKMRLMSGGSRNSLPAAVQNAMNNNGNYRKVDDFIVTSSGKVLQTNPADTIIGTKNPEALMGSGRGQSIYITIERVYGVDAQDVSTAIVNNLRKKIVI